MRKSCKITVILLCSVLLLGACSKKEKSSQVSTSHSKVTQVSKSSTKKKKVTKNSSSTELSSSISVPNSQDSSNDRSVAESGEAQSSDSLNTQGSSVLSRNENNTTNSEQSTSSSVENSGGAVVNSGTLELSQATPIYSQPDKSSEAVDIFSTGNIEFDKYFSENGEWWYSYVSYEGQRYYIAYSDINH